MGHAEAFITVDRKNYSCEPVEQRVRHFREFVILPPEEELRRQGSRCMDCGIPFCHTLGCPVVNLIPEFNDYVYRGRWKDAYERLELTNNLPEITGRICPAPCETACTLSINAAPVTIKQMELSIIERAFREGWVVPRPPQRESGRSVAVIGSGPAGLAAAQQLRRAGHRVTVFEKAEEVGGLLRYGIPDFKLEKWVLDRRIAQMKAEGIQFETNVTAGDDVSARFLRRSFNAILLTVGSEAPRDLPIKGRELEGVHFALEFLGSNNRLVSGRLSEEEGLHAKGRNVLVIGGGDTGSDCIGTSNRHGAASVTQIEIMPRPREWNEPWNPEWPEWPAIMRTSTSQEEGCERMWCVATKEFLGKGRVERAHCVKVEWARDDQGRMNMREVPGSDFEIRTDLVMLAMGFLHPVHSRLIGDLGLDYDARGNVKTADYATTAKGVFAAGDAATGQSLVVRAIFHGRRAAAAVDRYFRG